MARSSWKTRFGFYLAAVGSACGLGNLWRFPYVVGENGGGAFVLLYVLLALILGLPLMVGELILGRSSERSLLKATENMQTPGGRSLRWVGRLSVVMLFVVLSYYAVISGWVLHFVTQFALHLFSESFETHGALGILQKNGWLQVGLASVHLLICLVVVLRGVQEGLEKFIGAMMPAFTLLLLILMFKSISLPSSPDALRFLFYPDFSKLNWSSLSHAIGHVCFTLSVGFGTMVTFGSYMTSRDHVPTAGFRVTLLDTFLSLAAGLLVFPIALQASSETALTDPSLLFEVLPKFLGGSKGGVVFGFTFFVFLYLAALGASIGLFEVIVSNVVDLSKAPRSKVSWWVGSIALCLALGPALSSSAFQNFRFHGKSILESLDSLFVNWFLPLMALGVSICISLGMKKSDQEKLFVDSHHLEAEALFDHWSWALKYLVPGLIIFAMFLQVIGLFV